MVSILILAPLTFILVFAIGHGISSSRQAAREAEAQRRRAAEQARRREAQRCENLQRQQAAQQKRQEAAARKAQREAEAQRKREEKLEYARQMAELKERALQAEKELRALAREAGEAKQASQAAAVNLKKTAQAARNASPADTEVREAMRAIYEAKKPFSGERVAFTGRIPGYTREQAITATAKAGGVGYRHINTLCTLLVVGERPGMGQLDQADEWATRKITWQQWQATIQEA